jgi:hypothetical protein
VRRPVLFLIPLVFVLLIVWLVYVIASSGSRAEHALHATRLAIIVVEKYVQEQRGWPKSWTDLESISASNGAMYSWPDDSAEIRRYVQIDFDLTLEQVANERPDQFNAIRPKVPAYQAYREYVASLLKTVRTAAKGKNGEADVDSVVTKKPSSHD